VPFYIYRVSENFAILKDSWISNFNQAKNQTYYTVSLIENKMSQSSLTGSQFLLLNFDSDPNVLTTERYAYTIFDAISQTGGLMGVLYAIVSFLVGDI
jgi:hypothetical protein